jgi:FYVE/RhoGEF/PH domain-containing protein 5/6
LLREISKQIGDLDSKKKLSEAIEKVDEVGAHLNEAIRKRDNAEKIAQIQDQLDQNIDLIKPGRIFVKEGNLLRLTHKGNLEEHIFHLFNDLLICSKETIQGLQLKEQITLLKISISVFEGKETIGNTKIDKSCAFQLSSSSSSFVVVAKSTAERDEWMESIKEASSVENFYQKKNESTSKSLLKTVDIPENLRLSYSAPVWVPDTEVQTCALCDNEFGVLRRRHHCRNW